tara:strand:- start:3886 stop:4515 length:630 start_codon:yes stop_codon:yes gene_type:complete
MLDPNNTCIILIGSPRAGKSSLALEHINSVKNQKKLNIIISPSDMKFKKYADITIEPEDNKQDLKEVFNTLENAKDNSIIFIASASNLVCDLVFKYAHAVQNLSVLIDECELYKSQEILDICRYKAKSSLYVVLCTRRPQLIDKTLISTANAVLCFQISEKNTLDYLKGTLDIDTEEIRNLPIQHNYIGIAENINSGKLDKVKGVTKPF